MALSGDTALVGTRFDDVGTNADQGSAYVFTRSGTVWSQQTKLTASDGAANDRFGHSVALSGDTALVGAPYDGVFIGSFIGSAYVFTRSGSVWSQQTKLTASDGALGDEFGNSVALSGDTALVGARFDDVVANPEQGSAYVFTRSGTTWSEQTKLTASDGAQSDFFGWSVALSGDTALVGAYLDDIGANGNQGSAYVFTRSGTTWSQQTKLTASDGAADDQFGYSVALSGDTALMGANTDDVGANGNQGSAYVFTRNGTVWSEQTKLTASDGAAGDEFGISVALSGDTALVGAYLDDSTAATANVNVGSVYLFSQRYNVTPEAGANGSISPNTVQLVASGQTTSFVITPNVGYSVQTVTGCGGTWSGSSPYVTGPITADCTVNASFIINQYTVSFDSQGGSSVSPITQNYLSTVTVPAAPTRVGYTFVNWNTAANGSGTAYAPAATFSMPANNQTLFAIWSINQYTLNYTAGANGTLTGTTTQTVNHGASGSAVTAVANVDYHFVDWSDAITTNPRTDANVAGNLNVTANFAANSADLQISKSNGLVHVIPNQNIVYEILLANAGPYAVTGATFTDNVPSGLINVLWSCETASGSAVCPTPNGSGNAINQTITLPINGALRYLVTGTVNASPGAFINNTATIVIPSPLLEVNTNNNTASDDDPVVPFGIFGNGFETGAAKITVPLADDQLYQP